MNKILILDDDKPTILVFTKVLEEFYSITSFTNPCQALEYLKLHNDIDLCILDMIMPELDGEEFLIRLREFNKTIKVICITGYPDVYPQTKITKHIISDYMIKPIHSEELLQSVEKSLKEDIPIKDKYDIIKEAEKVGSLFTDREKQSFFFRVDCLNDYIIKDGF